MADNGQFFLDTKTPFLNADPSAVTLATTYKALVPAASLSPLGTNYFGYVGKAVRIWAFGRITTAATPGNIQLGILYGTGADANGTTIVQSGTVALVASQTNLSWSLDVDIVCRSIGSAGTLIGLGEAHFNVGVIASTNQPIMLPASAPAVSASVDLTSATSLLSLQALRSGSTAETMQVHGFKMFALN
jgi:hypothetical protein